MLFRILGSENRMKKLIIFGNNSFAELVTHYLASVYDIIAYTVDKDYISSDCFLDKPLISFDCVENFYSPNEYDMFVAIGYNQRNKVRELKIKEALSKGYNLVSYIHPTSYIDKNVKFGRNCFVFENSIIQPYVEINDGCIIWANATICHNSKIGKNVFIASNSCINGYTKIQNNTFIGSGAVIRDGIEIAPYNLIGAGCIIQSSTVENSVYKNISAEKLN